MNKSPLNFHLYIIGTVCIFFGAMMLIPLIAEIAFEQSNASHFLFCSGTLIFIGLCLILANYSETVHITAKDIYVLTALTWVASSLIGSMPFWFIQHLFSFTDSVFESVSGLTTTGASVITNMDQLTVGFLLWRTILNWIGGIGIMATILISLPWINIGGMQIFQSESSEKSNKIHPRIQSFIGSILITYLVITVACIFGYRIVGMSAFEAIAHAFSTVSTGGNSVLGRSFMDYSVGVLWVSSFFMVCGALPIIWFVKIYTNGSNSFYDRQVVAFLKLLLILCTGVSSYLYFKGYYSLSESFAHGYFNVISIITTTGFNSANYVNWGAEVHLLFLIIMLIGGCSGSTSGSIKIFRYQIMFTLIKAQIKKMVNPYATYMIEYNNNKVTDATILSITTFVFSFILVMIGSALCLSLMGYSWHLSITASISAIGNIGPGLEAINPESNFGFFNPAAKWVLIAEMILGRLEILGILVLFSRSFWRG